MTTRTGSSSDDCSNGCLAFRFEASLRRATILGIVGSLAVAGVGVVVDLLVLKRGPTAWGTLLAVCLAMVLVLLPCLGERVRVDQSGIRRRIFWWWDFWPWEAFVGGNIRTGFGRFSYLDPTRQWWCRELNLGCLEESDALAIQDLIQRIWTPPAPPAVDAVELRLGWRGAKILRLSADGVTVTRKGTERRWAWGDLHDVEIWRIEAGRQDFLELRLVLPEETIQLRCWACDGQQRTKWTGNTPEEISMVLIHQVPVDCLHDFAIVGPATSNAEIDARLRRLETRYQEKLPVMRRCIWMLWGLIGMMLIWFPWPGHCLIVLVKAPIVWAVHWTYRDTIRLFAKQRNELNEMRAGLESAANSSGSATPSCP